MRIAICLFPFLRLTDSWLEGPRTRSLEALPGVVVAELVVGGSMVSRYRRGVDSLQVLHDDVVSCRACPRLVAWREQVGMEKRAAFRDEEYWARPVPGFGDPDAGLVIVGLAPAAHGANRTGRMFTGDRSGDFLYAALHRAGFASQPESIGIDDGLALTGAWITAPVRCAPPANKPTIDERDACRPFLDRELALVPAKVFLVLGQFAYQGLSSYLGIRPRPPFGHGVEVEAPDGRRVLCSYHVSQQNTFTGKLTPDMFDEVLARARALLEPSG